MEEMKHNVEVLQKMSVQLEAARSELESINREEGLLEWEETKFPQLQQMFQTKDPYDKLWINALNFTIKSEEWMNGLLLLSSFFSCSSFSQREHWFQDAHCVCPYHRRRCRCVYL